MYSETLEKYESAKAKYSELCKKSKDIRKKFLEDRAEDVALTKGTEQEKEIKSIIQTEKSRDQAERIKRYVKKKRGGGPSNVLIPSMTEYQQPFQNGFDHYDINQIWERIEYNNGEDIRNWERINDQKSVQKMLLLWQRKHFTQANETPFANEKWRKLLQDEKVQEKILNGSYELDEELPLEAKELLSEIQRPQGMQEGVPDDTTLNDFKT